MACGRKEIKNVATFIFGFLECLLFTGSFYGWPSLVFVLKGDNVFGKDCPYSYNHTDVVTYAPLSGLVVQLGNISGHGSDYYISENDWNSSFSSPSQQKTPCPQQESALLLAFTIGSAFFQLVSFPVGWIYDKFGMRVTRLVATCFFIPGTFIMAFASEDMPFLIYPGVVCLVIAGMHILVSNMQIGNLFVRRSTVVALYNGCVDCSVVVFQLIKLAYQGGIPKKIAFLVYLSTWGLVLVSTFLLLPKGKPDYQKTLREKRTNAETDEEAKLRKDRLISKTATEQKDLSLSPTSGLLGKSAENNVLSQLDERKPLNDGDNTFWGNRIKEELSFGSCVSSTYFVFNVLWLSILSLRLFCFFGFMNPTMEILAKSEAEASRFQSISSYILMSALPFSLVGGILMDLGAIKYANLQKYAFVSGIATVIPIFVSTICFTGMSITSSIRSITVQYATVVLVLIGRAFLYSSVTAFLIITFPAKHFGKLLGLGYLISGILSFTQYALAAWAGAPFRPFIPNLFLLVLTCTTFVHPVCLVIRHVIRGRIMTQKNKIHVED